MVAARGVLFARANLRWNSASSLGVKSPRSFGSSSTVRALSYLGLVNEPTVRRRTAAENRSPERMRELVEIRRRNREAGAHCVATVEGIEECHDDGEVEDSEVVSAVDERNALRVLRKQLRSRDERVAQTAALKLLEWRRGKPGQAPPPESRPQRRSER